MTLAIYFEVPSFFRSTKLSIVDGLSLKPQAMPASMEEPLLPPSYNADAVVVDVAAASSSAGCTTSGAAASSSSSAVLFTRLSVALTLAAISLWANYEASKRFDVYVVNSAAGSPEGQRFDLMFVSNGKADRILYRASQFVERALYPDEQYPRKPVNRITLRMASGHLPTNASVNPGADAGDYDIYLSPRLMSAAEGADAAVASELYRSVARLWLWDGQRGAPEPLLESMSMYLSTTAGFPPRSGDKNDVGSSVHSDRPRWSEEFLRYCEARQDGFVARLNRGMRERWAESTADEALGSPARRMFAAYRSATGLIQESYTTTSDSTSME